MIPLAELFLLSLLICLSHRTSVVTVACSSQRNTRSSFANKQSHSFLDYLRNATSDIVCDRQIAVDSSDATQQTATFSFPKAKEERIDRAAECVVDKCCIQQALPVPFVRRYRPKKGSLNDTENHLGLQGVDLTKMVCLTIGGLTVSTVGGLPNSSGKKRQGATQGSPLSSSFSTSTLIHLPPFSALLPILIEAGSQNACSRMNAYSTFSRQMSFDKP